MAKGSGSARLSLIIGVAILCVLAYPKPTLGATYIVGGPFGWYFNVEDWPTGKSFKAGDVLEFKYDPKFHNLVEVDKVDYERCTASSRLKVHKSGNDNITLKKGQSYFICSVPGHCNKGMKIAVNAS